MSGFRITDGKGFHVTFDNGWTVSVQFGPYNYCSARDDPHSTARRLAQTAADLGAATPDAESATAEVAAWDANEEWYSFDTDTVAGWQTTAEVLAFMQQIASLPSGVPNAA